MKNVEDIYPLTPLQQGLLFHSVLASASGVYVNQSSYRLRGGLDAAVFRETWQRVVDRHTILRTAFAWEGLAEPVQAVRQRVNIPWREEDWREHPESDREAHLDELRAAERFRPFDLAKAPLARFALVRLSEDEHEFVWTFHHILLDGWSTPLLLQEVLATYAALSAGRAPDLPPAPRYRDYIAWLQRQDLAATEAFWRRTLAGFTEPTSLGIGRPAGADGEVSEEEAPVAPRVTTALQAFAARHHMTLNTLVLGSWAILLGRYSGEADVLFGSVVSGRPVDLPGVESMVGLFINTLPVRVAVPGEKNLLAWLQEVQRNQLELRQHEHSPLVQVQKWSDLPPGSRLFDSLFVFENYPAGTQGAAGGDAIGPKVIGERSVESTGYPLTLAVRVAGDLCLRLSYDPERFEASAARRLLGHLSNLLAAISSGESRPLAALPLMTAEEERQIEAWNDTANAWDLEVCLHTLVEARADLAPAAVAASFEGTVLSYRELDERANRLAHRLIALGCGPEQRVALFLERSAELIVALLAVLKSGAAYLPLDPEHPAERIAFQAADARPAVLLTQAHLASRLPPLEVPALVLTPAGEEVAAESASRPEVRVDPDHPAYVLYTSGSTGRPKGVAVPHRAIVNRLLWTQDAYELTVADRVLQKTPYSFDVSVWEFFWPLIAGARLVVAPPGVQGDSAWLVRQVREEGITVMHFVPSMLRPFLEEPGVETCRSLRDVMASGETLPNDLAQRFFQRLGARLHNLYGPTEAAVEVTFWACEPGADRAVPIGRPIANTRICLLDRDLHPVPVGVAGELYIGGVNLARGYFARPALTAESFVPDPVAGRGSGTGARLYKTGDLARYREDGAIEYLDRIDHQVKVRGFRIELGEIEATLLAHPAVREAVVVAREDRPGDRRLVAYVVGDVAAAEFRQSLQNRLPDAMVPAAFVTLAALPLNPNGKVDRKALPAPEPPGAEEGHQALRTPVEEILAGIWAEVLGIEGVGANNHFFELGGHSLLATSVVSRLRSAFGVELPLRELFEAPRLADLAARIEAALRAGTGAPAPLAPITPIPREGPLPLSFAQQRIWFIDQLEPGSSVYNIPFLLRIEGPLDSAVLALCLGEVVRRHEALRTVFAVQDSSPVQVIVPAESFVLPVVDLSGLPETARESRASALAAEQALRPFDLARGPLLRGVLLRLAASGETADHVVALTIHHIASDGWSMGILVREVAALYAAYAAGAPSPLPELPVQYADFAAWQRQRLQGEALAAQITWWRAKLAGAPPVLALPVDRPRPAVQRFRGRSQLQQVPLHGIADLAKETATTPFMILLAAFTALLARYSGQLDLVVGSPIAGRTRAETEPLIGLFLNTLALRGDLSGDPSLRELVRRMREVTLGAYAHQELPFEKLVESLAPERDLSHGPIFQVLFVLQNAPFAARELPGLRIRPVELTSANAKLDLVLNATEFDGGLFCRWIYNSDLFDATRIARLRNHFASLMEAALADPGRALSDLPLLGAAERWQILGEWGDTATLYPTGVALHELIAAQAERTPGAVAAVSEGALTKEESLTYCDLLSQSRSLARHLRSLGVERDGRVGVLAERSLEMIVGLLGTLLADAAYVPLDPTLPPERLALLLESAGIDVVLTQERQAKLLPRRGERAVLLDLPDRFPRLPAGREGVGEGGQGDEGLLAYVIYTSGSTGTPKGVMIPHRGIVNRLRWMQEAYGLTPADRVLQKTPFSFDVSLWEFFWPLLVGARLVFAKPEGHKDPLYLAELIAREGITTLHFVPSMLQAFLAAPGLEALTTVRKVVASGEALPPELVRQFFQRMPHAELHNLYGPTEASVDVSFWACEPEPPRGLVPIGRPIANHRLHVVDWHLEPQPIGVHGELLLGGPGLARGYLGRPDLTAAAFVPDPFGAEPGGRLYRTGDLVTLLPDGNVLYLGRIDSQVKVRGFRIELGEIETVLAAHPAVQQAVVGLRGAGTSQRLVAWVLGDAAGPGLADRLRDHLQARLPEHMIPAAFVPVANLPLTSSGKIDRRALPDPEPATGLEPAAPRTPLEESLAGLWREALGVESVGIHDSFFDLGGNSITGAILINRLQREIGGIIHIVTLFDSPTVAKMADYLVREEREAVVRLWGASSLGEQAAHASKAEAGRVDAARMAVFRALVSPLPSCPDLTAEKNPPAVFVLSPPRSGSTLLRVMLGGHPGLFAPPELELLSFNTMADREAAFVGRDRFWLEGVIRAVMEVRQCSVEEAWRITGEAVTEGWTTQRFYRQLQKWLGDRMLVDKTPSYAFDPAILRRAEEAFEKPFYIHLVRHPYAAIRSFDEAKLDELFFRHPHSFERAELAELLWLASHENIAEHLAGVPAERQIRVRFEGLVQHPEAELRRLCDALGIEFHPAMLDPYQERRARMTDGIQAEGRMIGDVKFLRHKTVDAGVAERWREAQEGSLGEPAWEMAARFGYERPAPPPPTIIPRAGERVGPQPLSYAQQRLFFLDRLQPGSPFYNIPAALRFHGRLDIAALEASLDAIVARHELLRTTFRAERGLPVQVIAPSLSVPAPEVDLRGLSNERREAEALRIATAEIGRPFDLQCGPLLRLFLLRLAGDEHAVIFTMHHIVGDGWSIGLLVRELTELYTARVTGRPARLPQLSIQYADFAVWQRHWLEASLDGLVAYWIGQLSGAPPLLELPEARPRPASQSFRGAVRGRLLSAGLTRDLNALSRRETVTLFVTLLAGLQVLLHARTGATDIVLGTDVAARNRPETENLIGFFINQLVLRADLAGDPSFRDLLARGREVALGAYAHQDMPFDRLVDALKVARSLSFHPLFQVKLVLQNVPEPRLELPDLSLHPFPLVTTTAQLDMNLRIAESPAGLGLSLEYSTDLYETRVIDRFLEQLEEVLRAAVEEPGQRLSEITATLAASERSRQEERDRAIEDAGHRKLGRIRRLVPAGQSS